MAKIKKLPTAPPDPDIIMTVRIPSSLHAELSAAAEREERTIAAVVRLAIKHYLAKPAK